MFKALFGPTVRNTWMAKQKSKYLTNNPNKIRTLTNEIANLERRRIKNPSRLVLLRAKLNNYKREETANRHAKLAKIHPNGKPRRNLNIYRAKAKGTHRRTPNQGQNHQRVADATKRFAARNKTQGLRTILL